MDFGQKNHFLLQIHRGTPSDFILHIGGAPCKDSHFIHNFNDMAKIQPLTAPLPETY